jgi:1,5-anhydro-D-fructose reductase (1,5-anhydro-D-mannitol-forming)
MSVVRWAFIGGGRHPRLWVAPAIQRAANAETIGVWSRQPEHAAAFVAEQGGGQAYATLADLLADPAVEAVFIATPNSLHASHALAALQAGKHVLVEKPMATTSAEARAMTAAARAAGRRLGVGFHFRHHQLLAEAQRRIQAGEIGQVAQITAQFNLTSSPPPRLTIAHAAWKRDPDQMGGAGALMGMGVHLIDLVSWLIGQPINAVQALATGLTSEQPLESMAQLLLEFAGGAQGHLLYGGRFPLSRNDVVVYGSGGRLIAEQVLDVATGGSLHMSRPEGATGWRSDGLRLELVDHYQRQIEAFSAAVLGGPAFGASGEDGRYVVAVTEAVIAATRSGRRVVVAHDD